jgi:aspartyl-tRNA(Asn)/glutamyl-tRNA(Gln) amidotransferase subunit C
MNDFSKANVAHLCELARIKLSESEIAVLAGELSVISDSIKSVQEVTNENVERTTHPYPLQNVFREDEIGETLDRDEVLRQAPKAKDGRFVVPKILNEE